METYVLLSVSWARRFYPYWQRLLDHRSYNILSLAKTRRFGPQRRKMNRTDLTVLLTCGWAQSLPGAAVVPWCWRTHSLGAMLRGQRTQTRCLQVCELGRSQHPLLNSQFPKAIGSLLSSSILLKGLNSLEFILQSMISLL